MAGPSGFHAEALDRDEGKAVNGIWGRAYGVVVPASCVLGMASATAFGRLVGDVVEQVVESG